jgi:hypothetical protein
MMKQKEAGSKACKEVIKGVDEPAFEIYLIRKWKSKRNRR